MRRTGRQAPGGAGDDDDDDAAATAAAAGRDRDGDSAMGDASGGGGGGGLANAVELCIKGCAGMHGLMRDALLAQCAKESTDAAAAAAAAVATGSAQLNGSAPLEP